MITLPLEQRFAKLIITWPLLPADFQLPDDPVEDENKPLLAAALRQPIAAIPHLMQDALVVSNFALCAGVNLFSTNNEQRIICKAPDWMYIKAVNRKDVSQVRRSYTPHTEGTIPQVVMEFLSETYGEEYSVESTQRVGKWFFYEQVIKVPRYVIFRATTANLEVYALESERYKLQEPDVNGRFWIPGLDLFLGVWEGTHEGRTGYWLRWWNAEGDLLLWSEERIEKERQRAERLAEKLRQAGIEIEEND